MVFTVKVLILLVLTLLVCVIGFKRYVWFISVGYGLSISAISIGCLILFGSEMSVWSILYGIVMTCYGFRLGGYLLYREVKTAYSNSMKGEISDGSKMSFGIKIALWVSCALLYIMMMAPMIYRGVNNSSTNACEIVGLFVSAFGIILEATADAQKTKAKKTNPKRFVSNGLFKIVRCPNYLGELTIWTGMLITAFGGLTSVGQWIVTIIGYLGIVYVMFSGARRLEIRQDKNYGAMPEYQEYKKSTPILLPLIPLYSVKKHKWLVG